MIKEQLMKILGQAPDVYEDFAFGTALVIMDLGLTDEFFEFHEDFPNATTDEILDFIVETADLRPLPIAK